ncbi:uncharacterized protein K02A2.6-like [Aedes albopictus]|uniref:RNA-directed DNA polymerase n=1 Tax=Aedes albopictus TaxID=7160 RepID=A0ABM1ZY26_AEDAL
MPEGDNAVPGIQQVILQMAQLLQQMAQQQQQALPQVQSQEQILESLSSNITEFAFDEENGVTFGRWFDRYQDLFENDARQLEDAAKVRLLLRKLDTPSHSRYINYILPKLPKDVTFEDTVKILKKIFGNQVSTFRKRFQCLQLVKSESEDIISYGGHVNRACEDFQFQNLTLDHFKCLMFVSGLKASKYADVRARLLSIMEHEKPEAPATLQSLIDEYQRLINLKEDTSIIEQQSSSKSAVHAIRDRKGAASQNNFSKQESKKPKTPCWQCGQMHFVKECVFNNHLCRDCNRVGHKEGYCSCSKKSANPAKTTQSQSTISKKRKKGKSSVEAKGVFVVNHIEHRESKRKFVTVAINGVPVPLQLDSASDISIVSETVWKQLGKPAINPSSSQASNASGDPLSLVGEFECEVSIKGETKRGRCFVTSVRDLNLMGIEWIDLFNFWSIPFDSICNQIVMPSKREIDREIQQLKLKHKEVFNETLGLCNRTKVQLHLKPGSKPVFCPKRPVPFHSVPLVDAELNRLQSLGIITPVDFSEWAAPIVAVKKPDGRVRICADYSTGLNNALEANNYPLPVPEEIFAQLAGCQVFSVIDLSDAYLQCEVTEDSKQLLTINTHRGLFRFNRLAPGVKSAPGAFQRMIESLIADLPEVRPFIDDIIIFSKDWKSHAESLNKLLQRLTDCGFHLKIQKCKFFQTEVRYLGHITDRNGIRPDPEKVETISSIPPPTNVSELRSYLGAVNYYGKFVRNIHELRHPLDQLMRKDVKWNWSADCQRSFEQFKEVLKSDLLLTHYNPKLPIVVAADASKTGIGAVIFHKFPNGSMKAIQHASRTLTPAEQAYGQPEKEALALVYGLTKFHKMLLGRRFTLQTDHKPLLSIFGSKKGIPVHTANRLQRWALIMLNYDFDIQYVSTNEFGCADMLSRLIDGSLRPEEDYIIAAVSLEEDMASILNTTIEAVPVSFPALRDATSKCEVLQQVKKYIVDGWPANPKQVAEAVLPYYNRRESLSIISECVMFKERVIVPEAFRRRLLHQFHQGHPGMVRMKTIARNYVYWPGLDGAIEDYVRRCSHCATAAKAPVKAKPEPWPTPEKPWTRIHIDYAGPVDGNYFLVVVDPFSRWPEIVLTKSMTAKATIKHLKQMFATFGIPETVVSDNGTQFTSFEFQKFCESLGIHHIRTAPYHPQSNGLAERFVDTVKRSVKKICSGGESLEDSLQTFLTVYRSTPTPDLGGQSPAERMLGRSMRSHLLKEC